MDQEGASWPVGPGTMAGLIRAHDWTSTPLGPITGWPQCLRVPIELMLSSPQPAYVAWGPDLISFHNDDYAALLQGKRRQVLGQPFRSTWAELLPVLTQHLDLALSGTASAFEDEHFHLPGRPRNEEGWFSGSWIPLRDGEGSVAGFMTMFIETTTRVLAERDLRLSMAELERAQAALAANEERLRLATESADILAWEIEEASGLVHYSTDIARTFGFDSEPNFDQNRLIEMVHPEDQPAVAAAMRAARASGNRYQGEFRVRVRGGWLWVYTVVEVHRRPNGTIDRWIGMSQDIDQHKQTEGRQVTLLAELQHRVRNILAMIRSIARRTGETCLTAEDFVQHLDGRIDALARTQAVLTRNPGSGVDLRSMIMEELCSHGANEQNVQVSGPDVLIAPKAAEVLALALHELTTNSVKYGALGRENGRLTIRWRRQRRGNDRWLRLAWQEQGVPLSGEPDRTGFGTELITRRVPYELHGRGKMHFRDGGLSVCIEFPIVEGESILQTSADYQASERRR